VPAFGDSLMAARSVIASCKFASLALFIVPATHSQSPTVLPPENQLLHAACANSTRTGIADSMPRIARTSVRAID